MFLKRVTIMNPAGLHARPAGQLVQLCKGMPVDIKLVNGEKEIDPRGIMAILTAGMKQGTEIAVQAIGEDEEKYGEMIVGFIQNLKE